MVIRQPNFAAAFRYAEDRLRNDLSPLLFYHGPAHTLEDVLPAVERLGVQARVDDETLLLLRTAALFHDLGFTRLRVGHEAVSIEIARYILPRLGYSAGQVDRIARMIQATRLPQSPRNLPEQLLADADLDVLGRSDYIEMNHRLRAELTAYGVTMNDQDWYAEQVEFLQNHSYFTPAAHQLRDAGKRANLEIMRDKLAAYTPR
ncbi:MAG: HD domain-containing protein [Chloroflexota bacterium]